MSDNEMINFTVEREYAVVKEMRRYEINSDGTQAQVSYDVDSISNPSEITTGFLVQLFNEQGLIDNCIFYPVETNMDDFTDNSKEVLERIKGEYTPDKYQNNCW